MGGDPEFLDQGKQTKVMHVQECSGPPGSPLYKTRECDGKGVMDVRNGSGVPRATGQGACEESESVIDEVGDDHFNDL